MTGKEPRMIEVRFAAGESGGEWRARLALAGVIAPSCDHPACVDYWTASGPAVPHCPAAIGLAECLRCGGPRSALVTSRNVIQRVLEEHWHTCSGKRATTKVRAAAMLASCGACRDVEITSGEAGRLVADSRERRREHGGRNPAYGRSRRDDDLNHPIRRDDLMSTPETRTTCPACGSSAELTDPNTPAGICAACGANKATAAVKHAPGAPRDAAKIPPESPRGVVGAKTGSPVPAHPDTPAAA
jgi:hypothetical protein